MMDSDVTGSISLLDSKLFDHDLTYISGDSSRVLNFPEFEE